MDALKLAKPPVMKKMQDQIHCDISKKQGGLGIYHFCNSKVANTVIKDVPYSGPAFFLSAFIEGMQFCSVSALSTIRSWAAQA